MNDGNSIKEVILDSSRLSALTQEAKHEWAAAIADLTSENNFQLKDSHLPPYQLYISALESRLILEVKSINSDLTSTVILSLKPFRTIIKDYFLICESYSEAVATADPRRIEAIDMGRRGIHNEGSELLKELLNQKITMDLDTARRLFTLICALHINI